MSTTYDTIGVNYADLRKPDPRIEQMIWAALGTAETVLNVGAGTGSYEPPDKTVTALEPSAEMNRQRGTRAGKVVQGFAEELPFDDKSFDASMAILTIHHWANQEKGLREMRRVTRGPVTLLTFDPAHRGFWLADYIPELVALDDAEMPPMTAYAAALGAVDISIVPVPHDCIDGFLYAYWRRPQAYLDPKIRAAMSSFWAIGDVSYRLDKLKADLDSGAWEAKHADLLGIDALDIGYRLVTTSSTSPC